MVHETRMETISSFTSKRVPNQHSHFYNYLERQYKDREFLILRSSGDHHLNLPNFLLIHVPERNSSKCLKTGKLHLLRSRSITDILIVTFPEQKMGVTRLGCKKNPPINQPMYIIGCVIHIYSINQYNNEKYVRPNPTHLTSLEFWSTHRIMHQTALWQQAYPTIPSCLQNHTQMFKMKDESSLISTMLHLHSSRWTITFDSSYIETQQYFEESYLKMKTSKIPLLLFYIF